MVTDPREQRVIDTVNRVGWMVMKVAPNRGDPDPQWFAYTIGLPVTFGWPELICFGLELDAMLEILNNAVQELKSRPVTPSSGLILNEVLEIFPVRLGAFSSSCYGEYLGWALWFARFRGLKPEQFGCLQLLWPDKDGYFPCDADCQPEIRKLQTPIARPH
jgi:hypothetical protein